MTMYRIQRMTNNDFDNLMSGSFNYHVESLDIEAENKEEAIKKAEKRGYIVNEDYVKTVEEIEKEEKEREERWKEREAKAERAKQKRKETEARKAAENGMTVEEYRKEKAKKARIKKLENEIAELEKELKNKKNYLKRLTK